MKFMSTLDIDNEPAETAIATETGTEIPRPRLGARFLRIWFGQTVSTVGSTLAAVGVAVHVYLQTGSEAWLGVLAAFGALPFVIVGPFLGLVDRFPRRSVMIGADVCAAVGPTFAVLIAVFGDLQVWHLAAAGFLGGLGTAVQTPAALAALPSLVEPDSIGRANGLTQLGPAIGIVAGPVLATPIVAWWGIEAVLLVDLATFVVGLALTLATRFDDVVDRAEVDDDGTWRNALAWMREFGRPLLALLAAMALVNFSLSFFNLGLLVLATEVGGPARAGLALGAGGAAMILGSLAVAATGVAERRVNTIVRYLGVMAAGTIIAAARPVFGVVVLGVAVALAGVPAVNAAVSTVFHERVPASMHGRVFGLRSTIGQVLGPAGSVLAGFVIANLAAPAMTADGALGGSVGFVIGTGSDRGAALVLLCVGGALASLAWALRSARSVGALDTPTIATPGDRAAP